MERRLRSSRLVHVNVKQLLSAQVVRKAIPAAFDKYGDLLVPLLPLMKQFNPNAPDIKEEDLKNTTYVFTLEDGSEVEVKGDEEIEYDGEKHTAANLFDAIKEGYYGKL